MGCGCVSVPFASFLLVLFFVLLSIACLRAWDGIDGRWTPSHEWIPERERADDDALDDPDGALSGLVGCEEGGQALGRRKTGSIERPSNRVRGGYW